MDCKPGEKFYVIDEVGVIAPCGFTSEEYGIASSTLGSLEDVQALPSRFRELQSAKRSVACDDCLSTQVFGKFVG